jgi:methyl-accepting chemotaxis protein
MIPSMKHIGEKTQSMARVTGEIANSIDKMASGSGQINQAVSTVGKLNVNTRLSIETLIDQVFRFHIG